MGNGIKVYSCDVTAIFAGWCRDNRGSVRTYIHILCRDAFRRSVVNRNFLALKRSYGSTKYDRDDEGSVRCVCVARDDSYFYCSPASFATQQV